MMRKDRTKPMENKQTAVEWLVKELNQKIDFIPMDKWDMIRDIVQQALAMEKEQIVNAWDLGRRDINYSADGIQYYNQNYGK